MQLVTYHQLLPMEIDEIVTRAIPLSTTCAIEKAKAEKRRIELKNRIQQLIDEVRGSSGMAGNAGNGLNEMYCVSGTTE